MYNRFVYSYCQLYVKNADNFRQKQITNMLKSVWPGGLRNVQEIRVNSHPSLLLTLALLLKQTGSGELGNSTLVPARSPLHLLAIPWDPRRSTAPLASRLRFPPRRLSSI